LSFFDEDEPTSASTRESRVPRRPRPRPYSAGVSPALDRHTLMVRRRIAAGVGLVLIILIVLIINGCLKSHSQEALKDYNEAVGRLVQESDQQISHPLFAALASASGKSPLDVEFQINQLRLQAQAQASRAQSLSVPGAMSAAQRNLLLVMDLRAEGMAKIASLIRTALGGQSTTVTTQIAGDMEIFLASDVLYSQRVAPLSQQTLKANGINGQSTTGTRFLPNLGWLDPTTVAARLSGQAPSANGRVASGTHGHSLTSVSVGTNTLQPATTGTINHVKSGSNPTFTVTLQNGGTNNETNVKVEVAVTVGGKQLKAFKVINRTIAGASVSADIPLTGVPLGAAARISVIIQPVPGEQETENNKGSYLAIFS
jgi:hypothetical protein